MFMGRSIIEWRTPRPIDPSRQTEISRLCSDAVIISLTLIVWVQHIQPNGG